MGCGDGAGAQSSLRCWLSRAHGAALSTQHQGSPAPSLAGAAAAASCTGEERVPVPGVGWDGIVGWDGVGWDGMGCAPLQRSTGPVGQGN